MSSQIRMIETDLSERSPKPAESAIQGDAFPGFLDAAAPSWTLGWVWQTPSVLDFCVHPKHGSRIDVDLGYASPILNVERLETDKNISPVTIMPPVCRKGPISPVALARSAVSRPD